MKDTLHWIGRYFQCKPWLLVNCKRDFSLTKLCVKYSRDLSERGEGNTVDSEGVGTEEKEGWDQVPHLQKENGKGKQKSTRKEGEGRKRGGEGKRGGRQGKRGEERGREGKRGEERGREGKRGDQGRRDLGKKGTSFPFFFFFFLFPFSFIPLPFPFDISFLLLLLSWFLVLRTFSTLALLQFSSLRYVWTAGFFSFLFYSSFCVSARSKK